MTRWFRGPELERPHDRDRFDPRVDGARHRLPPELLLAIWERACADATDSAMRRDDAHAQRRFHELAARIAARGGRLRPDIGASTRVDTERNPGLAAIRPLDELRPRAPGRQNLSIAEQNRAVAATLLRSQAAQLEDGAVESQAVA